MVAVCQFSQKLLETRQIKFFIWLLVILGRKLKNDLKPWFLLCQCPICSKGQIFFHKSLETRFLFLSFKGILIKFSGYNYVIWHTGSENINFIAINFNIWLLKPVICQFWSISSDFIGFDDCRRSIPVSTLPANIWSSHELIQNWKNPLHDLGSNPRRLDLESSWSRAKLSTDWAIPDRKFGTKCCSLIHTDDENVIFMRKMS